MGAGESRQGVRANQPHSDFDAEEEITRLSDGVFMKQPPLVKM